LRSIYDPNDDLSVAQAQKIALMQSSQMHLLDYFNEFSQGVARGEMDYQTGYTLAVTMIATAVTIAASIGISGVVSLAQGATQTIQTGLTVAGEAVEQSINVLAPQVANLFAYAGYVAGITALSVVEECFEEIIVDELVGRVIEDTVENLGGDESAKIFWSVLGESLREGLMGIMGDVAGINLMQDAYSIVISEIATRYYAFKQAHKLLKAQEALNEYRQSILEQEAALDGLYANMPAAARNSYLFFMQQGLANLRFSNPALHSSIDEGLAFYGQLVKEGYFDDGVSLIDIIQNKEIIGTQEIAPGIIAEVSDPALLALKHAFEDIASSRLASIQNKEPFSQMDADELRDQLISGEIGIEDLDLTFMYDGAGIDYRQPLVYGQQGLSAPLTHYIWGMNPDPTVNLMAILTIDEAIAQYKAQTGAKRVIWGGQFTRGFLDWCYRNWYGPFPIQDPRFRNIAPELHNLLIEQLELELIIQKDYPVDLIEWVINQQGTFVDKSIGMRTRYYKDIINKISTGQKGYYKYVKLFIKEIFRFTEDNGISRKLITPEIKIVQAMSIGQITTYYHQLKDGCKAISSSGYTIKLLTTPEEFLRICMYSSKDPSESHVWLLWEETGEIFKQRVAYLGKRKPKIIDDMNAKSIMDIADEAGFIIVESKDKNAQALNLKDLQSLIRLKKAEGIKTDSMRFYFKCKRCGHISYKTFEVLREYQFCESCSPKLHIREEYAFYNFLSLVNNPYSGEGSLKMAKIDGENMNEVEKGDLLYLRGEFKSVTLQNIFKGKIDEDQNYHYLIMDKNNNRETIILDARCHVDMIFYVKVKIKNTKSEFQYIKDKNGNDMIFKIALERQGKQHENSLEGFATYLGIIGEKELQKLVLLHYDIDKSIKSLKNRDDQDALKYYYEEWQRLIIRDEKKVKLFKYHNMEGYYLIVMDHKVAPNDMLGFISSEFSSIVNSHLRKNNKNIKEEDLIYFDKLTEKVKLKLLSLDSYIKRLIDIMNGKGLIVKWM
jgi:hypothetical protein